ncbi:MAG: proteasome accessory factor PafA2 family protein, partial [Bifidobacteriaceae bacterium]|nr:proteasome accessory factor PafA2 family protein [Bifidobacteriaceae bacterium]
MSAGGARTPPPDAATGERGLTGGAGAVVAFGIETEYGVLGPTRNPVELSNWVVAAYKASLQGRVAAWDYGSEDPLNDARGFRLDRAAAHPSLLTDAADPGQTGDRPDAARPSSRVAAGPVAELPDTARASSRVAAGPVDELPDAARAGSRLAPGPAGAGSRGGPAAPGRGGAVAVAPGV